MRILVAANLVPFMRGGADLHVEGLSRALEAAGHDVNVLQLPFKFFPEADIVRAMDHARSLELAAPNGRTIDRIISLQFPAWGVSHPDHWVWVMHQHRSAYDLFDANAASPESQGLRPLVKAFDDEALGRARALYANSKRVAERLMAYNGLASEPLYHPPFAADQYYCADALPYLFLPSRIEGHKRQMLVVEAAAHMRSNLKIVIAGEGGQLPALQARIKELGLRDRVELIGQINIQRPEGAAELRSFYAHALAVLFPALDEDYGYVTLEGMLSSKPVVICTDAGGALEFVEHGRTGWIEPPEPRALAARFDQIAADPVQAAAFGRAGRERVAAINISWDHVVRTLTRPHP